jgi:putative transposase
MRLQPRTSAFTAVTHQRLRIFQRTSTADLMVTTLFRYRDQGKYLLHGFVVMPDHLHALFTTTDSVGVAAQLIKGGFSFAIRNEHKAVWQDGYHEHRIRDAEDFHTQLRYIANNPARREYTNHAHIHTRFVERLDPMPPGLL